MSTWELDAADLSSSTSFRTLARLTAPRSKPVERAQELTTAFLLAFIERELSGRREDRITGAPSHRRYFVGTLAPRKDDDEAPLEGEEVASIEESQDFSSIGARFMIKQTDIARCRLKIAAEFSIFHPVFPTWQEVVRAIRTDEVDEDSTDADATATPTQPVDRNRKVGSREYNLPTVEKRLQVADAWEVGLTAVESAESRELRLSIPNLVREADRAKQDPDALRIRRGDDRLFKRLESITPEQLQGPEAEGSFNKRIAALREAGELVFPTYSGELSVSIVPYDQDLAEVSVVLTNSSKPGDFEPLTKANFFDTRFSIIVEDATIQPVTMTEIERKDALRSSVIIAKGVRCAIIENDGKIENLPIPFAIIPARTTDETLEERCTFEPLTTQNAPHALDRVADALDTYAADWKTRIERDNNPTRRGHSEELRQKFLAEIARFRRGIAALRTDPRALTAFRLANQTILTAKGYPRWRPFQLVFFVSVLKDIVARERPDVGDDRDNVDVLWFPTGGGKTETYLALILFTLVYDRLRGKHRGVSAWVKFPLRMLSLDQLDRFAEMLMVLTQLCSSHSPQVPGDPFEIGYFMGDRNTPNQWQVAAQYSRYGKSPHDIAIRFDEARKGHHGLPEPEIAAKALEGLSDVDTRRYMLIDVCPIATCDARTYLWPDSTARTMAIKCPTHGRIPIRFIDDELYRHPTSIIISTIDKLAIIAFNDGIRNLIVRPYYKCRDHGYLATNTCKHCDAAGAKQSRVEPVESRDFRDPAPALQVQDELHLLKEQLGAYDSHYEALVAFLHEELLTRPGYKITDHKGKTKVVAATATIASFEEHVAHLYGKHARRFPEKGPAPGETAYSRELRIAGAPVAQRIMAAVWPTMTRLTSAVSRTEVAYLTGHAALASNLKAYRDMLSQYAPSTANLSDGQLLEVLDQSSTLLTYYMNKARAYTGHDNIKKELDQAVESDPSHPFKNFLSRAEARTLTGDSEFRKIRETKSELERGGFHAGDWLAHVAATSIISHGVDVGRLNAIIFSGMPADTAEYIQSSSRVGRRLLGLSLVVHDTKRPREEGHYINHLGYHANLDLHIHGVAINRGSRLLLGRTFPGLFAGLIRLYWNPTRPKNQAFEFSMRDARPLVKALQDNRVKTELREILRASLGRSTAVRDAVFLEEEIEREWNAMEQEGLRRFGETDSLRGLFREHRPLLNHREIEASFPLMLESESHEFVDRRSAPMRIQPAVDEPPAGEIADTSDDDAAENG